MPFHRRQRIRPCSAAQVSPQMFRKTVLAAAMPLRLIRASRQCCQEMVLRKDAGAGHGVTASLARVRPTMVVEEDTGRGRAAGSTGRLRVVPKIVLAEDAGWDRVAGRTGRC